MRNRNRLARPYAPFVPQEVRSEGDGTRPSVQVVLDLVDTQDPAWPSIAATLREFTAAGIDLDATSVTMAVKLGKQRCARDGDLPAPSSHRLTLVGGARSIVYYIRRCDLIKIGTTTSPAQRFSELLPDEILAAEPGTGADEARRHRQFRHLRCGGEYFRDEPELRDHIRCVRSMYGEPDPTWRTSADLTHPRNVWQLPLPTTVDTMTAMTAAEKLGIKEMTIRGWVHRGRLQIAGRDEFRRHLFYVEHLILLRDSTRRRMSGP